MQNIESSLENLIKQTYQIEQEYKTLGKSYENLQKIIKGVIEELPTALWVLNSDASLFLQNSLAVKNEKILKKLKAQNEQEIEIDGENFLVKIVKQEDKSIIMATEITRQKITQRLASMGQVAAHLAHEIRNPIGSAALLSSTLIKRCDEKSLDLAIQIRNAIYRVERIIKATLLFTKGLNLNKTKINFKEIEYEIKNMLKMMDYAKDIKFNLDFGSEEYFADMDLLNMVFENLIINAIDAIEESEEENGNIKLWYEQTSKEHKFFIYDSGVDIKNTNYVFEPFKSTKLKGNGLGLALCLQIIQAHNGSIEINLNPKTFCVSLPI